MLPVNVHIKKKTLFIIKVAPQVPNALLSKIKVFDSQSPHGKPIIKEPSLGICGPACTPPVVNQDPAYQYSLEGLKRHHLVLGERAEGSNWLEKLLITHPIIPPEKQNSSVRHQSCVNLHFLTLKISNS